MSAASSGKIDFERGMSAAPAITIALIVLNAAVFLVTATSGLLISEAAILSAGALSRQLVFQGEVWRLLSATFLHGSFEHLVANGIGLFIFGMAAEHAFGKRGTTAVYFVSGLTGSLFSVAMNPGPAVGASGAVFGLLGATIVFFLKYSDRFHLRDKRIGNVLIVWALYSLITAAFAPFVDNAAHVGGLLGGALCGYALTPELISREAEEVRSELGKTRAA